MFIELALWFELRRNGGKLLRCSIHRLLARERLLGLRGRSCATFAKGVRKCIAEPCRRLDGRMRHTVTWSDRVSWREVSTQVCYWLDVLFVDRFASYFAADS